MKLENILYNPSTGQIKLIDFGFALASSGPLLTFCGTPSYMCPEIVKKVAYDGTKADVWSCGVVLYILLMGKMPFFGEYEGDMYRKIQTGKYTAIPNESQSLRQLFSSIF